MTKKLIVTVAAGFLALGSVASAAFADEGHKCACGCKMEGKTAEKAPETQDELKKAALKAERDAAKTDDKTALAKAEKTDKASSKKRVQEDPLYP